MFQPAAPLASSGAGDELSLSQSDFDAFEYPDGLSPSWPIDYATLAPWYDLAEEMYRVRGAEGVDMLRARRAEPSQQDRGLGQVNQVIRPAAVAALA